MSAIDSNQPIPLTPFTVGQVLALLDASECAEWHRLTAANGEPTSVRVESLSGKGYLSAVHRITFGFADGQNAAEFRVVLKVPTVAVIQQIRPLDSPEKVNFLGQVIAAFHTREVAFYGEVVPKHLPDITGLSALIPRAWAWQDCGQGEDGHPKLGNAFLLLEDLSIHGQSHAHALSEEQIDSVVVAMARLHANSFRIPAELMERNFLPQKTFRYDKSRLHQQLCSLPDEAGIFFGTNAEALTNFIECMESGQEEDFKIAKKFGIDPPVLCHGDLWVNNLLFDAREVKGILDWQCVHLGSGLSDICHFLLTGVDVELRRSRTEHWLALYHAIFVESLASLPAAPKTPLANLETVKAVYRAQFPAQVHFLMCLEAFFVKKAEDQKDREERDAMRKRLIHGFEEIKADFAL